MTNDRFKLTAKQERFCLLIVKGEAQTTAYEQAGYSAGSKEIAASAAVNLMRNVKVQQRLEELYEEQRRRHNYDSDIATKDLLDIQAKSIAAGSFGPAVQAVLALCKIHGLVVDRSEVSVVHRPAPLPTKVLELSEDEWLRQFGVEGKHRLLKAAKDKA